MHDRVRYYRVCNWEKYQVFKDGRPMKFFAVHVQDDPSRERRAIQNNDEFLALDNRLKIQLLSLWVLAAQTGNKIPDAGRFIEYHNMSGEPFDFPALTEAGFLELLEESVRIRTDSYGFVPRVEERRVEENGVEKNGTEARTKRSSGNRK